jgi:hypothetical protein
LQHDDIDRIVLALGRVASVDLQLTPQIHDGQQPAAQPMNRNAMHKLNAGDCFGAFETDKFE